MKLKVTLDNDLGFIYLNLDDITAVIVTNNGTISFKNGETVTDLPLDTAKAIAEKWYNCENTNG